MTDQPDIPVRWGEGGPQIGRVTRFEYVNGEVVVTMDIDRAPDPGPDLTKVRLREPWIGHRYITDLKD